MATTNSCVSNHSSKVRVIAKIRDFTKEESESSNIGSPWICVYKPNESGLSNKFTISIGDQPASRKDRYEVDYVYQQNEDIDSIFSREIQPLVSEVFDGLKASVVAYGARGSGKTYTIQGYEEKPGLATLALAAILQMAKENGNLVTVSLYEIFQEHVYDLLDSNYTEVQVLEDAHCKIKLKGLSRVTVESISEFHKLYYKQFNTCKSASKTLTEVPRRSHKGLMINLLSCDEKSNKKLVGKMNFVDLAGYEASRRNGSDESTRINKSLYSLQNVVNALVANESRVPYRESKLTRVLQDSLVDRNRVVMLTCLNPLFCQDTICMLNLSLRPCQNINQFISDSQKKSRSAAKPSVGSSSKSGKLVTVSGSMKKQMNSRTHFFEKKACPIVKGRKLFDDGIQLLSSKQGLSQSDVASVIQHDIPSLSEELPLQEMDVSICSESSWVEETPTISNSNMKSTACFYDEKENENLLVVRDESPPLSVRLREISNSLKSLSTTPFPSSVSAPQQVDDTCCDVVEPKTPVVFQDLRVGGKSEPAEIASPWGTFSARSSGLKQSLVQGYIQFLNSASKEELKSVKGIGEKRATYILELREESPEPFKTLEDLQGIGLSEKQVKGMLKKVAGDLFV